MPSKDFEDFVRTCFPKTFGEWHDGLDIAALLRLVGEEFKEAEKLILSGIPKSGHSNNSIEAAGYLRLQSAGELLKKELKRTKVKRWLEIIFLNLLFIFRHEYFQERIVKIAWALYQIDKYPDASRLIIAEIEKPSLTNPPPSFFQMYALRTLISFGNNLEVIAYLKKNVQHGRLVFESMYALASIEAGQNLPFHEKDSEISQIVQKQLATANKTWE
ncbi:MAG: hypothetical protein IT313_13825 [Anaerolineales bacterium]|nr:hypothetical protein [Anaerolineales bacterium]